MNKRQRRLARLLAVFGIVLGAALVTAPGGAAAPQPRITTSAAFDVSPPAGILRPTTRVYDAPAGNTRSVNAPVADVDAGYAGDAGLQTSGYASKPASGRSSTSKA